MAQSLAREFGPQGLHVSHTIIDGVIDIPRTKAWVFEHEDAKLSPDAVSLAALVTLFRTLTSYRLRTHIGICILSHARLSRLSWTCDLILRSGRALLESFCLTRQNKDSRVYAFNEIVLY